MLTSSPIRIPSGRFDIILLIVLVGISSSWGFTSRRPNNHNIKVTLHATVLRKNVELPLLDVINRMDDDNNPNKVTGTGRILTPLPSSHFPDPLATPFLYGLQVETPLHKLILEEATSMAMTAAAATTTSSSSTSALSTSPRKRQRPMYGQLVWKNGDSLIGAIGCTAEILLNSSPSTRLTLDPSLVNKELDHNDDNENNDKRTDCELSTLFLTNDDSVSLSTTPPSLLEGTPPNTVLCRGGFRFVVKEVVKTIPFPIVIVDEIEDDADNDDSVMFVSMSNIRNDMDDNDDHDDEDDDEDELSRLIAPELIRRIMLGVQGILSTRLDDAIAKNNLSPLEKSILENTGLTVSQGVGGGTGINPAVIELAHAEELVAVWEVFQSSLVDDIEPKDRRFSVAIMAAELVDMSNTIRKQILLTRNSEERLRIVLREINEIEGMAKAKRIASKITDQVDEMDKNLKVGKPQLPPWALRVTKGTKIEYFWNEEYGWCKGEVIDEPVTIVDEILLTIRFDDGEIHKLPLMAEEKVRWRPG